MGDIVTVKCNRCGYSKEYLLGAGMLGADYDVALALFPSDEREEVNAFVALHGKKKISCVSRIGKCSKCRTIANLNVLKITGTDGEKKEFATKCKTCRTAYREIDIYKTICPDCKCKLNAEITGHWD